MRVKSNPIPSRGLVNVCEKLAESVGQRRPSNFSFGSGLGKANGRLWAQGWGVAGWREGTRLAAEEGVRSEDQAYPKEV